VYDNEKCQSAVGRDHLRRILDVTSCKQLTTRSCSRR